MAKNGSCSEPFQQYRLNTELNRRTTRVLETAALAGKMVKNGICSAPLVVYSNVIRHMCDTELWLVEIIDWGHVTPKYSIPIGREPAVYGHLPYRHDFWVISTNLLF